MWFMLAACIFGKKEAETDGPVDSDAPPAVVPGSCEAAGYFEPEGIYEVLSLSPIETYDVPSEDMRFLLSVPENPKAVVWVFHGSGSGIDDLQQIEYLRMYNPLFADGYAMVATDSIEQGIDSRWDSEISNADDNVDMVRVKWLRDFVIETTAIDEDTPMFGMGFSNGSEFTGRWAFLGIRDWDWDIRALNLHNGSPFEFAKVDTYHHQMENDDVDVQRGFDGYLDEAPNKAHTLEVNVEVPLDPLRMISIGIPEEESLLAFDELVALGAIDADGVRLFDIADFENILNQFVNATAVSAPDKVESVLRVVWATHRLNGEFNRPVRNLFTCDNL